MTVSRRNYFSFYMICRSVAWKPAECWVLISTTVHPLLSHCHCDPPKVIDNLSSSSNSNWAVCKGWIPAGFAWLLSVLVESYTLTSSWPWRTVSVHLLPNWGHLYNGHGKFWAGSVWSKLSCPGNGRICGWLFVADVCLSCNDVGEQLFKSQDWQRLQTSADIGSVISLLRPWHCCLISAICDCSCLVFIGIV